MPLKRLFAALYDRALAPTEEAGLRAMRAELLAQADGVVVELGAGTGLNLPHYDPARVERVVATEPDAHMARHIDVATARVPVEVVAAGAEALPLGDGSADTVVCTLVLCTVPDPEAALREVARVLRPGGRLLFLEHVRSDDPQRARWQDRLERPWGFVGGGCHPNRDTRALLEHSPLELAEVRDTRIPKAPAIVRPAMVGTARRDG